MGKYSAYDELTELDPSDEIVAVDVSDTSEAETGKTKRVLFATIKKFIFGTGLGIPDDSYGVSGFRDPNSSAMGDKGWRRFWFDHVDDVYSAQEAIAAHGSYVGSIAQGAPGSASNTDTDDFSSVDIYSYNLRSGGARTARVLATATTGNTVVGEVARVEATAGGNLSKALLEAYNTYGKVRVEGNTSASLELEGAGYTCMDIKHTPDSSLQNTYPGTGRSRLYFNEYGALKQINDSGGSENIFRVNDSHLPHHSGLWYTQPGLQTGSNDLMIVDQAYYFPFYAPWGTSYNAFTLNVVDVPANTTLSVAIYKDEEGIPGEMEIDGGTYVTPSGGNPTLADAGTFILSGWKWIGVIQNVTSGSGQIRASHTKWLSGLGVPSPYDFGEAGCYYQTGQSGLPASLGAGGSFSPGSSSPIVWLRSA